jgi:hypothetical protein
MDPSGAVQIEIEKVIKEQLAMVLAGLERFSLHVYSEKNTFQEVLQTLTNDPGATEKKFAALLVDSSKGRELDTSGLSDGVLSLLPVGLPTSSKAKTGLECHLVTLMSMACCISAEAFLLDKKLALSIRSATDASQWMGYLLGNISGFNANKELSESARKKAIKRHQPNAENREKVFDWCEQNMDQFATMDAAAFDIAETFVPNKFRTVHGWIGEWKKERSAGKP